MNYSKIYENCSLCPRNCHIDRTSSLGFCQSSSQIKAARAALHHWEEPCISGTRGSGAVFFSGCTLRCCFCQNYNISSETYGKEISEQKLAQIFLSNYNKIANRFIYWLHPEKDALGLGYQLLKAKESIVLGGWFGTSSVTELPVKTSDLVYPALIQRCGMIFALLVFIVFIMMWLEGVRLFVRKQDRYHRAVGAGFVFMLFDQTLIIIAGSTGLCPLTGITLPFISSGGTSLMISFMIVGLIVAVSSNVKWKGTVEDEEEQDKFFKENAVTAKCHAYLRHLNDHFSRESFRAASGRIKRSGQKEESGQGKDI